MVRFYLTISFCYIYLQFCRSILTDMASPDRNHSPLLYYYPKTPYE